MDNKPFWESKTFWVNALAVVGSIAAQATGNPLPVDPETQATGLAFVNIVLRFFTKSGVSWS